MFADTDTDGCTVQKLAKEGTSEDNVMREAAESLSMFFAADSSGQYHYVIITILTIRKFISCNYEI
jgi:hypothetical protein